MPRLERAQTESAPPAPAMQDNASAHRTKETAPQTGKRPAPAAGERRQAPAQQPIRNPLTGLDRRTSQKLARGKAEIDARIDLHGMGREQARTRLLGFLQRCRGAGHRTVLVITGKGQAPIARHTLHGYAQIDTPEREGILRRALSMWFEEQVFRDHVSGYQPAHPRHGGGGAFYVRLRRTHRGQS